jgi:predicted AlkP superfamily phosphohydrolase/phosphomutase
MDPGQLGIYGFRNRIPNSYELARLETSATVRHPRIWDYLEDKGHSSILIGIPQTYPARPHNGITVGDFLAPRVDQRFTYPSDLFYELNSLSSGEYLPDVKDFRTSEKDRLLESLYEMVDRRFNLLNKIVHRKNWNFLMMVEIALDRLHHGFWRFCRKDHHLFEPGNKFENVFREFYRYLDSKIGTFLALIDDNTDVMVISDHGARTMLGGFCINEWLVRKGLLHLKPHSNGNGSIKPEYIDWDRTKVWSEGGYYARIFINLEGRDPNGIVSASEYDSLRNRLSHELESLSYDDGKPMRNIVLKPEEIYRTTESFPPDLMVYFDELNRRSIGSVGDGRLHVQGNDTGPDDANHDPEGIFIFTHLSDLRSGRIINERIPAASCLDITPTILHQFRLAVPKEMTGKVISTNGIEHASVVPAKKIPRTPPSDRGFTADEEEIVTSRLRDLGYI